jgi:arsenate reductase
MQNERSKILVLCTGNSARSQMAEALLRQQAGTRYEVFSAGLEPKGINPFAIRAMDEIGIDIRGQRSKSMDEFVGQMAFDVVITVCGHADQHCPQALWNKGGVKLHWPFEDPAAVEGSDESKLRAFRETRDGLEAQIKRWVAETQAIS